MAKFVTEAPDLTLELTILDGTEIILAPKEIISSKVAKAMMNKWTDLEKKHDKEKISPIELLSKELSFVYDRPSDWFEENLDVYTLQKVLVHVAQILGGAKKKETN